MKIMLSAGEVSGDVHGSYLVKELKKLRPAIYFFGLGSEKLAAEEVDIKFDISKRGTIGILEALPNLIPLYLTFRKMKKLVLAEKPDLVLLIDSQGFNLPLAKFCKAHGIKTAYYVAPQEWLWGTPRGVKRVAETVDLIVAIFKKEYEVYKAAGANVVYFGHPLVDIVTSRESRVAGQICLCPGSRTQELRWSLPLLLKAAEIIQKEIPAAQFILPAASHEIYNKIKSFIGHWTLDIGHLRIVEGNAYDALSSSTLALCTSGTINLEASILGTPNLMIYKLSPLTYVIGKYLLKIDKKIKFFSMPNILLDEKLIPELVMGNANPEKIAATALAILKDPVRQNQMQAGFKKLKNLLGEPGAIKNCAQAILNYI